LSSKSKSMTSEKVLKVLYILVACLCMMMINWVFLFPATWALGLSEGHKNRLEAFTKIQSIVPPSLLMKYEGHPDIQLGHTLMSGFWSMCVPFQIHEGLRKKYRTAHRWVGYFFTLFGVCMMVGLALIDHRKLSFLDNDFQDVPESAPISALGFGFLNHHLVMRLMGVWFLTTLAVAVLAARRRDFVTHRKWIYRHVGSGIWVAVQRLYVVPADTRAPRCRGGRLLTVPL